MIKLYIYALSAYFILLVLSLAQTVPSINAQNTPTLVPTKVPVPRPTRLPTAIPTPRPTSIPNSNDPFITSFAFDASFASITINFNRLISAKTFDYRGLALQSGPVYPATGVSQFVFSGLFNNPSTQGNTSSLLLYLNAFDYSQIQFGGVIGIQQSSTFLTLVRGSVLGAEGTYMNQEVSSSAALLCAVYIRDTSVPFTESFNLNMNTGVLEMSFSEPMRISSFNLMGIAFQSQKNALSSGIYLTLVNLGSSFISASSFNRIITFQLGATNLNNVKAKVGLCNEEKNCYMSAYQSFVKDASWNNVSTTGFERVFAMQISNFVPDTNVPVLTKWELELNLGLITLFFTETVYLSYFNYTKVILVSSNSQIEADINARSRLQISNPDQPSLINSPVVSIYFNFNQLNEFKDLSDGLCSSVSDCYLILYPKTVSDTAEPPNVYQGLDATFTAPLRVSKLYPDITPPTVMNFTLDLTTKILTIVFSEIISITSVQLDQVTLQSSKAVSSATESLILSSSRATLLTTRNSISIRVLLSNEAYSTIRSSKFLGKIRTQTFIACKETFLYDKSPNRNPLVRISTAAALAAAAFIPDRVRPSLASWQIDMGLQRLYLTFSEPMELSSFKPSEITLFRASSNADGLQASLSLGEKSKAYDSIGSVISIQLDDEVSDSLKGNQVICTSRINCFISLTSLVGTDTATYVGDVVDDTGAILNTLLPINFAQVDTYIADAVRPLLKIYSVNMNSRTIFLNFNEPVQCQYVDASGLKFYENVDITYPNNHFLTLTNKVVSTNVNTVNCTLFIDLKNFVAMKAQHRWFLTSEEKTFMSILPNAIKDMNGNSVNGYLNNFGNPIKKTSAFFKDTTLPKVIAVYRDNAADKINVYFDNLIDADKIDEAAFTLIADSGVKVPFPTGSKITVNQSYVIQFDLQAKYAGTQSFKDKLSQLEVATTQSGTFLFLSKSGAVLSYPGAYPNEKMTQNKAVKEGNSILSFRMNLDLGYIELETVFRFDVKATGGIKAPSISIVSTELSSQGAPVRIFLTEVLSYNTTGERFLRIYMVTGDINKIKTILFPIRSEASIRLEVLDQAALQDTDDKYLSGGYWDSTPGTYTQIPCRLLAKDVTKPTVASFDLDMNSMLATIRFSEPILTSSISTPTISFVNAASGATEIYSCQNCTVLGLSALGIFSQEVEVKLTNGPFPTLLNKLHLSRRIASSRTNTYLILSSQLAGDASFPSNVMDAVPLSNALQVQTLTFDRTQPQVTSYKLDMTLKTITLTYSEAVNITSNDPKAYYLIQDTQNYLSKTISLLSSTTLNRNEKYGLTVVVQISDSDFDNMMWIAPNIALTPTNSFLAFRQGAVVDIAWVPNPVPVQLFRFGLKPTIFIPDTRKPALTFVDISMQNSWIDFFFDEVVDCTLTDVTKIMFQFRLFTGTSTQKYSLTSTSSADCVNYLRYDKHIRVVMSLFDLSTIKSYKTMGKSRDKTFAMISSGAFYDPAGNSIAQMIDGFVLPIRNFFPDTVNPTLLSYTVSSQKYLSFVFSEPMNPGSLNIKVFRFIDQFPVFTKQYYLAVTNTTSVDSLNMNFELKMAEDFPRITSDSVIFTDQTRTFLTVTADGIKDMAGNPLNPILVDNPLGIGPSLKTWDLDMDAGIITLVFSEAVNGAFSIRNVSIQNSPDTSYTSQYFLTQTNVNVQPYMGSNFIYYSYLSEYDKNEIKQKRILATNRLNAYLVWPYGKTKSQIAGTIIPYMDVVQTKRFNALVVRKYTKDITPPILKFFYIDLSVGSVNLAFNEPVDAATFDVTGITLVSYKTGDSSKISNLNRNVVLLPQVGEPDGNVSCVLKISVLGRDLMDLKRTIKAGTALDQILMTAKIGKDLSDKYYVGNDVLTPISSNRTKDVKDTAPPLFMNMSFDMKRGLINVFFDEYIDPTTVVVSNIEIWSTYDIASTNFKKMTLSAFTIVTYDPLLGAITINLGTFSRDLNILNSMSGLAKNKANSWVAISGVKDIFGNGWATNLISGKRVYQTIVYTPDLSPLHLLSFDFVITTNVTITLYFDKGANFTSFDCADYRFSSSRDSSPAESVSLSTGDCVVTTITQGSSISFNVSSSKFSGSIGNTAASTFIFVPVQDDRIPSTKDFTGIALDFIPIEKAIVVGGIVSKVILNMDRNSSITLVFSREINLIGEFHSSGIGFYSEYTGKTYYLTEAAETLGSLITGSAQTSDSITVIYISRPRDINFLKLIDVRERIFFILKNNSIYDTAGKPISATPAGGILINTFVPDTSKPLIQWMIFDLGSETITFVMTEPIQCSSITLVNFRIQDQAGTTTNNYRLSGGSVHCQVLRNQGDVKVLTLSPNQAYNVIGSATVTITLSKADSAALKLRAGLAKVRSNSFLSFSFQTAADMSGNFLPSISAATARQFDDFQTDVTKPEIVKFDFDLNIGMLTIYFSEPVSNNIVITELTILQRYAMRDGSWFRLTGGSVVTQNSDVQRIMLLASDIEAMKNLPGLARSKQSTYIILSETFVKDIFDNNIVPIKDGVSMGCSEYTRDSTPPEIISSTIDLDDFSITFYMTEMIPLDLVSVPALSFQSNKLGTQAKSMYTLLPRSKVVRTSEFSRYVKIKFDQVDLNSLKSRFPVLSTTSDGTYIAYTSAFIKDTSLNSLAPRSVVDGVKITEIIADTVTPKIWFYQLDMTIGLIRLTFSEAIQRSSVDLSQIYLQSTDVRRYSNWTNLADCQITFGENEESTNGTIFLSEKTSLSIKDQRFATQPNNSFLFFDDKFVSDFQGLHLPPQWDGSVIRPDYKPYPPDVYIEDLARPLLLKWYIERSNQKMHLFFDEPIAISDMSFVTLFLASNPTVNVVIPKEGFKITYFKYRTEAVLSLFDLCLIHKQCTVSNFLSLYPQGSVLLNIEDKRALYDLANIPNPVTLLDNRMREGGPICDSCPFGQWMSKKCTAESDRECSICQSCKSGMYASTTCQANQDTQCSICSSCPLGTYISSVCNTANDAVCSRCTLCGGLSFEFAPCENGFDTVCASCKKCVLTTDKEKELCNTGAYFLWSQEQCCFDRDGKQSPCSSVDRQNMLLATRDGHRQWVFDTSYPEITGKDYQFPRVY